MHTVLTIHSQVRKVLEANDPPSSVYSIDSFDSPVDTFDRRYFWVWPCEGRFIEAGIEAWDWGWHYRFWRLIIYNKLYKIHNIISNHSLHMEMSRFAGPFVRVLTKFMPPSPPPRRRKSGEVGWGEWVSERRGRGSWTSTIASNHPTPFLANGPLTASIFSIFICYKWLFIILWIIYNLL